MKRTLRYSLLLLLSLLVGNGVFAATVTDELTWEGLGLTGTNSNYNTVSDKTFASSAVYQAIASSGKGLYIQLRSNKSDAGIVTTKSGGKVKSVTIAFNSSTTDRGVTIYAKKTAYTSATELYDDANAGTKLGDIFANADSKTLTVSGDYEYVAIRATNGAVYIDKITIEWEAADGGDTPTQETLAEPTISGETPFTGSTTVTISHEKDDAVIYYYTKEDKSDITEYEDPFSITETTTVYAYAEWDDENDNTLTSKVVSKTFTKAEVAANIREFNAIAAGTSNVVLTLKDAVVLGCGNNNYVINDGTAGTNIFRLPSGVTATQGTVLNGTIKGTRADYNGIPQMSNATEHTLVATEGTATPTTVEPAALTNAELFGALYRLEGVTIKQSDNKYYIYDGETQIIQVYNQFKTVNPTEGTFNIEGVVGAYNNRQFWLTKMEAAEEISYADMTVAQLCELTAAQNNINLAFNQAVVVLKESNSVYIREGENAICAYALNLDGVTWKVGQTLDGTLKVNMEIFRGMKEIKSNVGTDKSTLTITEPADGATVEPTVATIAELLQGKHSADYIILKNVEIVTDAASAAKGLSGATADGTTYYAKDEAGDKIQLFTTATTYTSKADDGNKYDLEAVFASAQSGSQNITPKKITAAATGIGSVKADNGDSTNAPMYNLAGQKVGESYKGIVIKGGVKRVQK